ncbi:MAG: helix-turn-helix transcriptional regulator [bacterium]|nr:helix-turn-helix transcriptional regulator [bacterium]
MNIKKLLGKRLQEIRKTRKLTQEQVAERVGMETSSISNVENGKYYPSAENLDKILNILDVKPGEVFAFESLRPVEELIDEMFDSMKNNEKLARLMYKFYTTVKY